MASQDSVILDIHYRLIAFMYSVKCFPFVAIKQNCLHSPLHNSFGMLGTYSLLHEGMQRSTISNQIILSHIIYEELETIEVPHFESKTFLFSNQKNYFFCNNSCTFL
jgi:hypothetical protein